MTSSHTSKPASNDLAHRLTLLFLRRHVWFIRAVWGALFLFTLVIFAVSVPAFFNHQVDALHRVDATLSLFDYYLVWHTIILSIIAMLAYAVAAGAIFWHRSDDWMAVLVSTALLMIGAALSPTLDMLVLHQSWFWPVVVVQVMGLGLMLLVFYLFPDGRFVPRWTRSLALLWIGWLVAWAILPSLTVERNDLPLALRYLSFLISSLSHTLNAIKYYLRVSSLLLVMLGWFGSGVFAQIYRFKYVSTPIQRQQTKWVVFGLVLGVVGYFAYRGPLLLFPRLASTGMPRTLFILIGEPISILLMILTPISMSLSMLRRRLWVIDPIIQNTLVYGTLTGGLAIIYLGGVFVFQLLFRTFLGQQSDVAVVIATLGSAAMFQPLRRRLQNFIDRRFYRERVDFRRAITTFSREIRTIIDLPELLRILVERTTDLLHITHGAVFLQEPDGSFQPTEMRHIDPLPPHVTPCEVCDTLSQEELGPLTLSPSELGQLQGGRVISRPKERIFSLLVPLIAPRMDHSELIGVLALGSRLSGQEYSQEDQSLLLGLADQAGTAIYVARLVEEKQSEAKRREQVERRLQAHRNSPIGQAEAFAEELLFRPETALVELHRLTRRAGQDPSAASIIDNLPSALDNLGVEPLAKLAEGFNYLFTSQFEPEMLPVGLRIIISQLEDYPVEGLQFVCRWTPDGQHREEASGHRVADGLLYRAEGLGMYRLCQTALEVNSIAQITELLLPLRDIQAQPAGFFDGLTHAMNSLHAVADALYAYERVESSRDKLSYLVSAVERLGRVDYIARTDLNSADRPVIQAVAERWLTVVTGVMSELQTRAQLVCRLLTRHTWQDDVVPVVLSIRNEGRGTALNLNVTLSAAPEYTLLDEGMRVKQIAPGEEVRVELRVRPHLAEGADQFRARFVIQYTDPRGPDQVENFADMVRLLVAEGEFQFIPNPYVVGTPLEAGSPLFFGREDVISFIQQNLEALHRNNLVLIGQRRTGKTSLLKQLPVRLGDDYLPVYLDGQALGLDPGLPNFFLAMATEIAFAMEDRGFVIELPEYEDFSASPSAAFERRFLARVREAIGQRHLLIMFDEFEELESAVERGNLEASIFGFLRHLIQHSDNLSVIFCGTHRLEELASDYWSVLFNISLYRQIAFLEKPEAMRLIQDPVLEYEMRYDDLALDKMWYVTAGHPYFLQLLCHSLVNHHNKTERSYVTVADVNAALEEILASGEAHFVYLWTDASPEERLVLASLSRMVPLTGYVTLVQVMDYLDERGVHLERRVVSDAMHRLALRNILQASSEEDLTMGQVYRWRLGLLGLWVEKYRSLSRVIEEVAG